MNDILGDTDLLQVLLTRVIVVGVHNDRGVGKTRLFIKLSYTKKILVVVVRHASSGVVNVSAQDRVGVLVALAGDLPSAIEVLCFYP